MWEGSLKEEILSEFVEAQRWGTSEDDLDDRLFDARERHRAQDRERKRLAAGKSPDVREREEAERDERRRLAEEFARGLAARGCSLGEIARRANDAEVSTPSGEGRWAPMTVRRLLGRPDARNGLSA